MADLDPFRFGASTTRVHSSSSQPPHPLDAVRGAGARVAFWSMILLGLGILVMAGVGSVAVLGPQRAPTPYVTLLAFGLAAVGLVWIHAIGRLGTTVASAFAAPKPPEVEDSETVAASACPACGAALAGHESDCPDCGLHLVD